MQHKNKWLTVIAVTILLTVSAATSYHVFITEEKLPVVKGQADAAIYIHNNKPILSTIVTTSGSSAQKIKHYPYTIEPDPEEAMHQQ